MEKLPTIGDKNDIIFIANNEYRIQHDLYPIGSPAETFTLLDLNFQYGLAIEDLLEICKHRLQCYQETEYSCTENQIAITKIEESLLWLYRKYKIDVTKEMEKLK
jgi:hypothetical protein